MREVERAAGGEHAGAALAAAPEGLSNERRPPEVPANLRLDMARFVSVSVRMYSRGFVRRTHFAGENGRVHMYL